MVEEECKGVEIGYIEFSNLEGSDLMSDMCSCGQITS